MTAPRISLDRNALAWATAAVMATVVGFASFYLLTDTTPTPVVTGTPVAGAVWRPFSPLVLQPGQTGTITVTFTPTGAAGTTVSGVLYVDTFSASVLNGDELIAIPYSYTIG